MRKAGDLMARIRTIKPEFFTSEDICSLSPLSRLFYVSLWCESDRVGRLAWKPNTFKLRYFPGDECDIHAMGAELVAANLIVLYEVDGKQYAEIPTFETHQVINNREAESSIPAKPAGENPRVKVASVRVQAEGRKEGKGKERKEGNGSLTTGFDEFWNAWPKNERKQDKGKCLEKWTARNLDELKDLILGDIDVKKRTQKWQAGYIEAPEVYLNNSRWEDGVVPEDRHPEDEPPEETPYQRSMRLRYEDATGTGTRTRVTDITPKTLEIES